MARSPINDALINADQKRCADATMTVLDKLQVRFSAAEQIVGAAAVFLLLCERFNVPAQDAFTVTKNLMNDANKRLIPEFRAAKQYLESEL